MARRQVTGTRKDQDGDNVGLCGPDFIYVAASAAIRQIRDREQTYFVRLGGLLATEVDIHVAATPPHLRTDPDPTKKNNLDDLPGC